MTDIVNERLIIDTVKIDVDGSDIKEIEINGRGADIFEHPKVTEWTEEQNGRIMKIEGEMFYKHSWLKFKAGYNRDDLDSVKVRRKGKVQDDMEFVKEGYELIYSLYEEYFLEA